MIPSLATLTFQPARLSKNPIVINLDAASAATYPNRAGLRYYCKVMVPESYLSAGFKTLVELEAAEQPPIPVGGGFLYQGAFFEIQNQLDPLLFRSAPEFNQTRITVADGLVLPFYVVLSVENNDVEISSVSLPVEYLVKAGINEVDYSAYKNLFFTEYVGANNRFLTWANNGKIVHPDQPEFLYFLTNFSPAPSVLKLWAEVTYTDYQTETFQVSELANISPFTTYCVPVGPKAIGLDLKSKTVLSYQVWLQSETGARVSEVREYKMNQEYFRNVRFVLFSNSLGGFDTLALVGDGQESLKLTKTISERFTGWEFKASYSEKVVQDLSGRRELSVSTGWLDSDELRYLDELQLSEEIFLVTDRAFVPLVATMDAFSSVADDEDLIGRTLTFQYANPQTNYSELPDPGTLTKRATGWRPKASACLLDANGRRTGYRQATVLEQYYLDDQSKVVGVPLAVNVPGKVGYIPPVSSPDCQVPAYLNLAISRSGTFNKIGCASPLIGGPATVLVAAGVYGSEVSQADAQAKAEREWVRLNTQAYANTNGVCLLEPEKYAYAVPSGFWHYRAADPALISLHWFIYMGPFPSIGNAWLVQGQSNAYVFPMNSNDLNFPIDHQADAWNMLVYGPPGTTRRVKIYKNGVQVLTFTKVMNQDGFEYVRMTYTDTASYTLVSGDKLYIVNEAA